MKKFCVYKWTVSLIFSLAASYAYANTYTSQGDGQWSSLTNWEDSNGNNPTEANLLDGEHEFVVAAGTTVTIDSDSICVKKIQVKGNLVFGKEEDKNHIVEVKETFVVEVGGKAGVSDYDGTHILRVAGGFTNNGEIEFRKSTIKVVNVVFVGTQTISGSGTGSFNNFEVASGTLTTATDLDIDGSFTVGVNSVFDAGSSTIRIAGNFTKNATDKNAFNKGTSTVILDGNTVQTISGTNNSNHFYNLTISGGGFIVVSSIIDVAGDFLITNNSTVNSSAELHFYGDFTVDAGSTYDTNTNYTCIWGGYTGNGRPTSVSDVDQTITINGDAIFAGISCRSYSNTVGVKTFKGSIYSTAEIRAWGMAQIVDDGTGYNHTFSGAIAAGGINLQSPMRITGGTIRNYNASPDMNGGVLSDYSLGSGKITIAGYVNIRSGGTLNVSNDIEIESGYIILNGSYSVDSDTTWYAAQLVGNGSNTLTVNSSTSLYIRGRDNYPSNFGSVVFGETSTAYYDAEFDQTVRAADYGSLYLRYKTKTFDGPTNIANHLYVYPATKGTVNIEMGDYTHTIGYNIIDDASLKGVTNITSTGTVVMRCAGNRSQYIYKRGDGTYTFNNLRFESNDPTYAQTKYITGDINVNGELELSNGSTNELLYLALDIDNHEITGSGLTGNKFVLGNNTRIKVSGTDNFKNLIESFASGNGGTIDMHANSVVQFDATDVEQTIPGTTYGNIYLYGNTVKRLESPTNIVIKGWINVSGYTPIFTVDDERSTIYIEGDWKLGTSQVNINSGSTVIFNGNGPQEIVATTLPNVEIRGNDVKTLKGTLTVNGSISLYSGSELDADNRSIILFGNWNNVDAGGGVFHQQAGTLYLRGIGNTQNINVYNVNNNEFYDIYVQKSQNDTLRIKSDLNVGRNFMTAVQKGNVDIENHTIKIGGDLYMYQYCNLIHTSGALLHFNSSLTEQLIRNYNAEIIYPTMRFSGSAVKRPYDNTFDIDGDVIIDNDAIVTSSYKFQVSGDWQNSGTFNHSSEVIFDGADQNISGSAFCNVTFSGTGTKRLGGNINVTGWLKIDTLATLDVSPNDGVSSFDIKIASHWYNNIWSDDKAHTGTFVPRTGTVTFVGNSTNIYSGDSLNCNGEGRAGKSFYNVVINASDPTYWKRLCPITDKDPKVMAEEADLYVQNDFTVNAGIFYTYWNNMYVGGNLQNIGGTFSMNSHYSQYSKLYLGGTSDNCVFDPGSAYTVRQIEICGGGTYKLQNDFLMDGSNVDSLLHIRNGELHFNGHSIKMNSSGNIFINTNGTMTLDSAAVLNMYNDKYLYNLGRLNLLGHSNSPAKIQPAASGWYYYLVQKEGTIAANYYSIEGTKGNGLDIQGGTIDPENHLQNGTFSNSGNSRDNNTALLTLNGIDLGSGLTIDNVVFNARVVNSTNYPKHNVQRTSGNGEVTFTNYDGTFTGSDYENDGGDLIQWESLSGFVWTNATGDNRWHNPGNWSTNTVPDKNSVVILDNSVIQDNYEIIVDKRAEVKKLTLEKCATLKLIGIDDSEIDGIEVFGDLTMKTGSVLVQTELRDSLILHGSWTSAGEYKPNGVPTVFRMESGTQPLTFPSIDTLSAMIIDGVGALSVLGPIHVKDSVVLNNGTLIGNNATIYLEGDWIQRTGTFDISESIVNLCGNDESKEQKVMGGRFWNIYFSGASTKNIAENISVNYVFRIEKSSGTVNAATNNIYMVGKTNYWYNLANKTTFDQTGNGSVVFNGGYTQIGSTSSGYGSTVFNNILIQGTGSKTFYDTAFVKGSIEMVSGPNLVMSRVGAIDGMGVGSMQINGGGYYIYGEDNFAKNMSSIDLSAGTVYYRDSLNQLIYPTQYSGLCVYNEYKTSGCKRVSRKILQDDVVVTGTLSISDSLALLVVDSHTITLTGGISMAAKGQQIDWGDNGTLVHVGSSWDVSANITDFCNVDKRGTGYLRANNNWTVAGNMIFADETHLYMRENQITCTGSGKSFSMGMSSQLHSSVDKNTGVAFPQGFASYSLNEGSIMYLEGTTDQILFSGVDYGRVYLNGTAVRTVFLEGQTHVRNNLYVNNDAITLVDNGHDLYLEGANNDLRNYMPTSTIYLDGDIDQQVYAGGSFTNLYLNGLEISGSGKKEINETNVYITGNINVASGATFSCNDPVIFSGESITNAGTFNHYGNLFTFTGDKEQTINMGADNKFYGLAVDDNDTVTVNGYGINVGNGLFLLGNNSKLDMGAYTHQIASIQIDKTETSEWITENSNFIFNRGGTQYLPQMQCKDIQFSTSGTKYLKGDLSAQDVTIDEGIGFSVGTNSSSAFTVYVSGSWDNNGTFTSQLDTVFFNSPIIDNAKIIRSNGSWFNAVQFNMTDKSAGTYKLLDRMLLKEGMVIGENAIVHLNGNNMVVGNDDPNSTEAPYRPDGEYINVLNGGELYVDGGAALQFDHNDGNTHLNVWGKLSLIGTSSANAVITRNSGNDYIGTEVDIKPGGKVAAKYYQVQYLAPTGFVINNGATIDDEFNMSNGIWSNMYTGARYTSIIDKTTVVDTFVYLTVNVESMADTIRNLSFIHGGTPVIGTHFNMKRDTTLANNIILGGTITGTMGYQSHEFNSYPNGYKSNLSPLTHNIIWPPITQIRWVGSVSSDWFNPKNWQPQQVPTADVSVLIPLTANSPIIYRNNAVCKNLTITNGALSIENGVTPINIYGSVDVQDGGVLSVEDTTGINVYGDWSIATKGYFVPQNGTVRFKSGGGSVSIAPRKSDFNNIEFAGAATYMITGSTINFNGDFKITGGLVWPSTANYVYNIKGDYSISGDGLFNQTVTGYAKFNGTNQTITNGQFSRVRFSNSGTKTLVNAFSSTYNSSSRSNSTIIIEDDAKLAVTSGCALSISGNVFIDSNATFDDGGETHTFTGYYWEDAGTHEGSGTVLFSGNHAQYIYGGAFHNLRMKKSTKYINGDVSLTGNLSVDTCTLDMLVNNITGPNSGTEGTFTLGNKANIYTRGADNYPKFGYYDVSPTSYSYYSGPMDQTIRTANYGNLYLNSDTRKTLEGDVVILKNLYFYDNGGILDANNKNIFVGQHWYNQYSGTFIPGTGRVIFNGTSGSQYIYLGVSVVNPFYDIEINKTVGQLLSPSGTNLDINNTLTVTSGKMSCPSGYKIYIGGDMQVSSDGLINNSGCYELNRETGICNIKTNGSTLNDLIINGGSESKFKLADDITVYGNFTLQSGEFMQNGYRATLGNSLDNAIIYGKYIVGAGGVLRIGDASSFVVKSGGYFEAVGSANNYAQVTNNSGRYYFTIESGGTIAAQYYNFSYLAKQGLIISAGAVVDDEDNFSNGMFSNVVSAGVCIDIRNEQTFQGVGTGKRISNISFPNNPGSGAVNIKKTESSIGQIQVYNATGMLAGALYENDPSNLIEWIGDVEYIWTAGANNNVWFDEDNWIAKINDVETSHTIPSESNNVVIPKIPSSGYAKFPIINCDSAFAKKLTVEEGAEITINLETTEPDTLRRALTVMADMELRGKLIMTTEYDTVDVYGNWALANKGKLTAGNGTVVLSGVGVKTMNNRSYNFNNLIIDNNGTIQMQAATTVNGDFRIEQGIFDVTSSNYKLYVGGDFVNNATFYPQSGTVTLTGTGSNVFDPGNSSYYNLVINSSGGTYNLTNNQLYINRSIEINDGTLSVVSNTINFGDGSGADNMVIGGVLNVGSNGKIKMGNTASISVKNGGRISLVGTVNNEAVLTSQTTSGTYSFAVESGGTIAADNYKIERINSDGVHLKAGSIIDNTYNMSNGQYVSGASGGRYIWFENNLASDDTELVISNLSFNAGPKYNAKRDHATSTGLINLQDAMGVVASYYFEDDDKSATTGGIRWSYTANVLYWKGGSISGVDTDGTRWDNPNNWDNQINNAGGVPNDSTLVFIPDVSSGSNKYPVLNSGDNGNALGITMFPGSLLTIGGDKELNVKNALSIAEGATLIASDGTNESIIKVSGQFANAGSFIHGGSSTVLWTSSENYNIEMNGCPFYNFTVTNANNAIVTFAVKSGESLVVENDFTIGGGTVDCNGGTLEVGGDFVNQAGTFLHGNGTVKMNGSSAQRISSTPGELGFYNLELTGSGEKNVETDIRVAKAITIGSKVKVPTADIYCLGDWKSPAGNYKNNFVGGTGKVKFCGTTCQTISVAETFTNVEFDNTSAAPAFTTNYPLTISGQLLLTNGILQGSSSQPIHLGASATLTGGGVSAYVNGTMEKEGDSDFLFPIGGSDRYAPIKISDLTSAGTYKVSYYSNKPGNQDSLAADINRISTKEYWNLTQTSGSQLPKVSLYWMNRNYSGLADLDVVSVVLYTGNRWQSQGETTVTAIESDTTKGYITTNQAIAASGNLTFGYTYPTIVWNTSAMTDDYGTQSNWDGKYSPSNTVNIKVSGKATTNHPVASVASHCYDMTVENDGILEIAANTTFTVHGNATISNKGKLVLGENSKILFKHNLDAPEALIEAANGSEIRICGETNQNVALSSCNNIVFEGGKDSKHRYVKTLEADMEVNGSLNVTNYTALAAANNKISIKGDITITSNGDFTGTSTIVLNGTEKQTINISPNRSLYNLIVNNTSETSPQVELAYTTRISNSLTLTKGIIRSAASARLTLTSNATSSAGNINSFVTGPMEKEGFADFVFPLGSDTILAKIGISGLGGTSTNIVAEYVHSKPVSIKSLDNILTNVSGIEYWKMYRTAGGNNYPHITLYWNDTIHGISDPERLRVAVWGGSKWATYGNSAHSGDSTGGYVKSENSVPLQTVSSSSYAVRRNSVKLTAAPRTLAAANYTAITLGSVNAEVNPLPIDLVSFEAKADGNNDVIIEWSTASENDNDYFSIEHMYDGVSEMIADVESKGFATGADYSYLHINQKNGTHYYRLHQTDFDGTTKVASDWVAVVIKGSSTDDLKLAVAPNPGRLQDISFYVSGLAGSKLRYVVTDMQGNVIVDNTIDPDTDFYRIQAQNWKLKPSVYMIRVFTDKGQITNKFVVE